MVSAQLHFVSVSADFPAGILCHTAEIPKYHTGDRQPCFYAIGSGWYTLLLLLSLLINYGLSCMISGTHARHPEAAKHYLIAGLIYNFGLLVVFKYTNFLIGNLNSLLSIFHTAIPKVSLVMPLGISFFTFQITSYLIDVYTGKTRPARSILDLGVYLCMFPQLISGPICMYSEISRS